MKKLTIVARIEVKKDHVKTVQAELIKLINITRAEEGCIQYDLHQDNDTPEIFVFYEKWENRDLWQTHMNNTHLAEYMKVTDGLVESFVINEMTQY